MRRIIRGSVVGLGFTAGQILHTAHRPDLPSLQNQDPSGEFGSPSLPRLRIVILGDSSVTAPGVEPLDDCFSRRVALALSDRYHVVLESVAVGGAKARDVLAGQVPAALATPADVALVSVGSNDALRGVPVREYERDLDEAVALLEAEIPAVGVFGVGDLGTVIRLPTLFRPYASIRSRSIDRAAARVAARHPGVVKSNNRGPEFDVFKQLDPRYFAPDQFHASSEGHAVFAEVVIPIVERLVSSLEPELSARRESRESSN